MPEIHSENCVWNDWKWNDSTAQDHYWIQLSKPTVGNVIWHGLSHPQQIGRVVCTPCQENMSSPITAAAEYSSQASDLFFIFLLFYVFWPEISGRFPLVHANIGHPSAWGSRPGMSCASKTPQLPRFSGGERQQSLSWRWRLGVEAAAHNQASLLRVSGRISPVTEPYKKTALFPGEGVGSELPSMHRTATYDSTCR